MFRRYYVAVFRELTPNIFKAYSNKMGHSKRTYVVVSTVRCLQVLVKMIYENIT
jgi:hypothetical protein